MWKFIIVLGFSLISPLPSTPPLVYQLTTKQSDHILSMDLQSDNEKYQQGSSESSSLSYVELLGLYILSEESGDRENVWVKTITDRMSTKRQTFLMMNDEGKFYVSFVLTGGVILSLHYNVSSRLGDCRGQPRPHRGYSHHL